MSENNNSFQSLGPLFYLTAILAGMVMADLLPIPLPKPKPRDGVYFTRDLTTLVTDGPITDTSYVRIEASRANDCQTTQFRLTETGKCPDCKNPDSKTVTLTDLNGDNTPDSARYQVSFSHPEQTYALDTTFAVPATGGDSNAIAVRQEYTGARELIDRILEEEHRAAAGLTFLCDDRTGHPIWHSWFGDTTPASITRIINLNQNGPARN